jgi:hypothetical protein
MMTTPAHPATPKPAAEEPGISPVTISYTTIAALDADPLFQPAAASSTDPKVVQSLGSATMGVLISFMMPYLKAALIKCLSEGIASPSPAQVLSKAHTMAEAQAKAQAKEAKT